MIDRQKELVIESRLREINKVEKFIEDLSDEYNINNTYFGNILIAVTEAVKNAIVHGNHEMAERKVIIQFHSEERGLIFSVEDQGEGFDFDAMQSFEEELDIQERKGIELIRALTDKVQWSRKGKRIEFEFHIRSLNFAKSSERINFLRNYHTPSARKEEKKKQKS